jgi:hypothetical protein
LRHFVEIDDQYNAFASLRRPAITSGFASWDAVVEAAREHLLERGGEVHRYLRVAHRLGHLVVAQQQGRVSRVRWLALSTRTFTCSHSFTSSLNCTPLFERGTAVGKRSSITHWVKSSAT